MRLAVIGGGAMGSLFAAQLAPHAAVWLLTGRQAHREAIARDGLRLQLPDGRLETVPVRVVASATALPAPVDVALILVKSPQTEAATRKAAAILKTDGLALTLQNGLGNLDTMAAALGEGRAAQGVTAHGASIPAPGRVVHAGAGPTWLAVPPGRHSIVAAVAELFNVAGLETHVADDLAGMVWGKLTVNAGINALTAILGRPNGFLADDDSARVLMHAAACEAAAVAHAQGIRLPFDDPAAHVEQVARATARNISSMLADVRRRVPTEAPVINGAVVRAGRRLGVPTPVNRALWRLVQAIEAGYADTINP